MIFHPMSGLRNMISSPLDRDNRTERELSYDKGRRRRRRKNTLVAKILTKL